MERIRFGQMAVGIVFAAALAGCTQMGYGKTGQDTNKAAMAGYMSDMEMMCEGMADKMKEAKTPEERHAIMQARMQAMSPDAQQRMHEHMQAMTPEARERMHANPESMCESGR